MYWILAGIVSTSIFWTLWRYTSDFWALIGVGIALGVMFNLGFVTPLMFIVLLTVFVLYALLVWVKVGGLGR